MNINDLIAKLQMIRDELGDCMVALKEVGSDRYGDTIGLVVDNETIRDVTIMIEYFGGEMPRW